MKEYIPVSTRQYVYDRDGSACIYCGGSSGLGIDHIHPEADGGDLDIRNLATCCSRCNSRKGAQPLNQFIASSYMEGLRATWTADHYQQVIDRIADATRSRDEKALAMQSECLSRFGKAPSIPSLDDGEGASVA